MRTVYDVVRRVPQSKTVGRTSSSPSCAVRRVPQSKTVGRAYENYLCASARFLYIIPIVLYRCTDDVMGKAVLPFDFSYYFSCQCAVWVQGTFEFEFEMSLDDNDKL